MVLGCGFALFQPVFTVSAHTLKIDGNIGVTVHIDPDDAPKAGEEVKIFVDIEDTSGRFDVQNPENCDCRLTVREAGVVIATLPVTTGGRYNQLRYTFAGPGVYTVSVTGTPVGKGRAFQAFRTDFEYYVSSGNSDSATKVFRPNPLRLWAPYIAAAVGSAIVLLFVL